MNCDDICEHKRLIYDNAFAPSLYSGTNIQLIVDAIISQQQDFIVELCASSVSLPSLAQLAGVEKCTKDIIDEGCFTYCGASYRRYSIDECSCAEIVFDDDFYKAAISANRIQKYPNKVTLDLIAGVFGWSIIYTDSGIYINVGNDSPQKASAVYHMFLPPIGESLVIISNC